MHTNKNNALTYAHHHIFVVVGNVVPAVRELVQRLQIPGVVALDCEALLIGAWVVRVKYVQLHAIESINDR